MNIILLTFSPLDVDSGHTSRLILTLNYLKLKNEITVICLKKGKDSQKTRRKFAGISFLTIPAEFDKWSVKNGKTVSLEILDVVKNIRPDIVVLTMEVWDLMREISKVLNGKIAFATIIHAMPFLGSPIDPSDNFKSDVRQYIQSNLEKYKQDYILQHYEELDDVFKNTSIIANNKTVAFYLKKYFKDLHFWKMETVFTAKTNNDVIIAKNPSYDFVYMARMESGKGIEYLSEILKRISLILNRKVSIAILGKTDDVSSKIALDKILAESDKSKYFIVKYFGWADTNLKKEILTDGGVFLYPSHYDNYPTVLNEALAFGLPSVVWDVPFTQLNYSNTKAVERVPLFNFQKFAKKAVTLLNNKDETQRHTAKFVNTFISPATAAQLDADMFKEISNKSK